MSKLSMCSFPKNLKEFTFKRYGSFNVEKKLGEGGFGSVYLVTPTKNDELRPAKYYAVKVSRRFKFTKPQDKENKTMNENAKNEDKELPPKEINFIELREICIMKQLKHENITGILDCKIDTKNNFTAILMEYFESDVRKFYQENLKNEDIMNEKFFKNMVRQLLKGVNYIHSKNFIHRDLKTDNLLFDQENQVLKISDFGFCRNLSFDKKPYTDVGTLYYKPPELLLGNLCYGTSFDVWSVGIIIIELLIAELPFKGNEVHVYNDINKFLGPIDNTKLKGINTLKNYNALNANVTKEKCNFKRFLNKKRIIKDLDFDNFYNFIKEFLVIDPTKRCTIKRALEHPWIKEDN